MSFLKEKSNINLNAARHLQTKYYYPSVVHCAYYSCIQLMKYILLHKIGLSENQMDRERKEYYPSFGVHQYLLERLCIELENQGNDWKVFYSEVNELKKLRTQSDYKEADINHNKSQNAIHLSLSIIKHLNTHFI